MTPGNLGRLLSEVEALGLGVRKTLVFRDAVFLMKGGQSVAVYREELDSGIWFLDRDYERAYKRERLMEYSDEVDAFQDYILDDEIGLVEREWLVLGYIVEKDDYGGHKGINVYKHDGPTYDILMKGYVQRTDGHWISVPEEYKDWNAARAYADDYEIPEDVS